MQRLLLIEDEDVIAKALRRLLERNHYEVHTAQTVEEAAAIQPQSFDLILADLRLPGAAGTSIISVAEQVPVVIMTSHASVRSAVDAMRHGAIDYISKPFDHDELLMVIERALQQNRLQAQNRALRLDIQRVRPLERYVRGTRLESLLDSFSTMRDSERFLHLHGESGTEREALARAIHANSERRDAPFVVADISKEPGFGDGSKLLESVGELTSQDIPPGGLLQAAQNGTLLIRYPENLGPQLQEQIADALQQGSVWMPESGHRRAINVRIITLSHHSIASLTDNKQLVPAMATLFLDNERHLPPLRDRPEDILPLAMQQLQSLQQRHGSRALTLSPEAIAGLTACEWAGNVAELDSILARSIFMARGNVISLADLGLGQSAPGARDLSLDEYFRYFVLHHQNALSETELAARLGISRKALWERRQKMTLQRDTNQGLSN